MKWRTITLTTGADTIPGLIGSEGTTDNSGDDTIVGSIIDGDVTKNTYQSIDGLNGGAGTDTLNLTVAVDGSAAIPNLTSIERMQVRSTADAAKVDASSGFETLINSGSTKNLAFAAIKGNPDLLIQNVTGNTTFTFADNTLGTTTGTVDLAVNTVGTKTASPTVTLVTGGTDVVTTMNLTATGANYISTDDSAGDPWATTKTLNVDGSGSVKITGGGTNALDAITTIAAGSNTGGVNVDLAAGGNDKNVTFTGGSGNDRVSFAATQLTTADVLDGGTGTNTLAILDLAITADTSAAINKAVNGAKNFQWLEFTGKANETAVGLAANGVTTINDFLFSGGIDGKTAAANTAGADTVAVTGLASDDSNELKFTANYIGEKGGAAAVDSDGKDGGDAVSLAPLANGPADAVTVTLEKAVLTGGAGSDKAGTGVNAGDGGFGIDARTFETVDIVSTGTTAGDTNTLAGGASPGTGSGVAGAGIIVNTNGVINITGANDFALTTQSADPTAGGVQVKAADFTGKLTVTGTTGADVIIGGSGADKITGGAGIDTLTGNGGADTFIFAAGDSPATGAIFDAILDFTKSTDILDFTAAFAVVQNNINPIVGQAAINAEGIASFNAGDDTVAKKITAVEAGINNGGAEAAGQFAVFEHGSDSYVFISDGNDNVDANDVVIKLTGLTGLTDTTINSDGNLLIA